MNAENNKLDLDSLKKVSGGMVVTAKSDDSDLVYLYSGPGFSYNRNRCVRSGTPIEIVEDKKQKVDGRTWYYVCTPFTGWITGDMIGMPDWY